MHPRELGREGERGWETEINYEELAHVTLEAKESHSPASARPGNVGAVIQSSPKA